MGGISKLFSKLKDKRVKTSLHIDNGTRTTNYILTIVQSKKGAVYKQEKWFVDLPLEFTIADLQIEIHKILKELVDFEKIIKLVNELLINLHREKKILFFT